MALSRSKQLVRAGQIATLVLVVLASAWAPQIERFGSLFAYLQKVLAYICPPIVSVFIFGLFWRKANKDGAFYSLIIGFVIAILLLVNQVLGTVPALNEIHFLHQAAYLFVICSILLVGISLATPQQEDTFMRPATIDDTESPEHQGVEVGAPIQDRLANYIWKSSLFTQETEELKDLPWYLNYRYQSIILLIITAILVGYFW